MSNIISGDFGFNRYIEEARAATLVAPTQVSIWAIAEYLDLVDAKELPANAPLVRESKAVVQRYVMQHLKNPAYVPFWERAGCLFKAYKRALKAAERALEDGGALQA